MIFNYSSKNYNNSKYLKTSFSEKKYNSNKNIFSFTQKNNNFINKKPNFYSIKKDFNDYKTFINKPKNNSLLNIKNFSSNKNLYSTNQLNIFDKINELNNELKSSSFYNKFTFNPPIIKNKFKLKNFPLKNYFLKEKIQKNKKIDFNKKNKINFIIPESKRIDFKLFNNINNFRKENVNFFREISKN
jgi:hypothetical protein